MGALRRRQITHRNKSEGTPAALFAEHDELAPDLSRPGLELQDHEELQRLTEQADGLQVVTKGGLVGDAGTTVACLDHLRRNADAHRRQVTAVESRQPY